MKKDEQNGSCGKLPGSAPLANPYVPFQQENAPKYDVRKGLVRGTMFPGLDLPFKGMINQNNLPINSMSDLQALCFAIQELALYLDTHKDDVEALELYRAYQKKYNDCIKLWEKKKRPFNHHMMIDCDCYVWLDDPWPWEYCANKEG